MSDENDSQEMDERELEVSQIAAMFEGDEDDFRFCACSPCSARPTSTTTACSRSRSSSNGTYRSEVRPWRERATLEAVAEKEQIKGTPVTSLHSSNQLSVGVDGLCRSPAMRFDPSSRYSACRVLYILPSNDFESFVASNLLTQIFRHIS